VVLKGVEHMNKKEKFIEISMNKKKCPDCNGTGIELFKFQEFGTCYRICRNCRGSGLITWIESPEIKLKDLIENVQGKPEN
jgi:DnaJ-class molecular chaperone